MNNSLTKDDLTSVGPDGLLHSDRALLRTFSGTRAQQLIALARWVLSSSAARAIGARCREHLQVAAALLLAFLAACACPTSESGVAVSPLKYRTEATYACRAVPGCDRAFLDGVRVYEVPRETVPRYCDGQSDSGCYCASPVCQSIFVFACLPLDSACEREQSKVMLHEWTHASFDSIGVDTADHGANFQRAWLNAQIDLQALRADAE